jgi:predicted secreted protein
MPKWTQRFAATLLYCVAQAAAAQAVTPPQDVLVLSGNAAVEVQQDLLRLNLGTTREGTDPQAVQTQLKLAVESALTEARRNAQPGQMDVRTGSFGLQPRYNREGRITGWTGSAEVVLEGRDFARITQTAGRIPALTVRGVAFALSREERTRAEGEAQAAAIASFKARAAQLASEFGFGGYTLREVTVQSGNGHLDPRMPMAMEARSAGADMAVPVEPGKSTVVVTVSGSVQLR